MEQPEITNPPVDVMDDNDRYWAAAAWAFPILVPIIVLFFVEDRKDRPFIKHHMYQALFAGLVTWVSYVLVAGFVGCVTTPLIIGYRIYLGFQAFNGQLVNIPLVTDFCKSQGWIA